MPTDRCLTALSGAVAATACALLVPSSAVRATVAYDGSASVSQNFDNLTSSNSTTNQRPWTDDAVVPPAGSSGSATNSLPGWYIQQSVNVGSTTGNYQRFRGGGTTNSAVGSVYSYGNSSDRALGILESTTVGTEYVALRLQNTSNQAITGFTLNYTGEQWFVGNLATNQTLTFGYKVEAASIQDPTFTTSPALSFTSPKNSATNGSGAVVVNGNDASNQAAVGGTITGLDWEPGQDLWLRWQGAGPISGSHGLAIDNLTFSGTLGGTPSATADPTYKLDADGTWDNSTATSWLNGKVPTGTGGLVRFGSQLTANRTITMASSQAVDTLEFNGGAHNYTLTGPADAQVNVNAGGSIVVNGVSFNSDNTPSNGTQVNVPIAFATDAYFRVGDPLGRLTVTGAVTVGPGGGLHLAGAGSVTLPASFANWSGPTTLDGAGLSIASVSQLGDGSATNTLALINGGNLTVTADMNLGRSLDLNTGNGTITTANNVTLGGSLSGTGTLSKIGAGTVSVSDVQGNGLYIAGTSRAVGTNGGVLQIAPAASVPAAARINFLRIETDSGASSGLYLGFLDLTNHDLIYDYTGTSPLALTAANPVTYAGNGLNLQYTAVAHALYYASDLGKWDVAKGIGSSLINSASADPNKIHALGYAEASRFLGLSADATGTFDGQTVDATSILIKYTLAGDANLDGKVDADDYAIIDRSIASGLFATAYDVNAAGLHGQWLDGDFNYDGAVDSNDLLIIDKTFLVLNPGTPDAAGLIADREAQFGPDYVGALLASVPEPSSLAICGLAALPLLRRRRSR